MNDQPDFGSQNDMSIDASSNAQESTGSHQPNGQASQPPSVVDISTLEKFKFGDRELTPDQLRKQMMLHQDYTKKTQEVAKDRRFYDNLPYDLEKLKKNPALVDEFMKVYPKAFHRYIEMLGLKSSQQTQGDQGTNQATMAPQKDPEMLSKLERLETYIREQEVSKHEAQLDAKFGVLSKKYPDADEDSVLARAQTLLDQDVKLTDQVWDKLWKGSHEAFNQKLASKQKQTMERQRSANSQANDTGSKGGTPGQAPAKMKLREVAEFAIKDLSHRGR